MSNLTNRETCSTKTNLDNQQNPGINQIMAEKEENKQDTK